MAEQVLTEDERQLLVVLVTRAWVELKYVEPENPGNAELEAILRKINGVDKQVFVR